MFSALSFRSRFDGRGLHAARNRIGRSVGKLSDGKVGQGIGTEGDTEVFAAYRADPGSPDSRLLRPVFQFGELLLGPDSDYHPALSLPEEQCGGRQTAGKIRLAQQYQSALITQDGA